MEKDSENKDVHFTVESAKAQEEKQFRPKTGISYDVESLSNSLGVPNLEELKLKLKKNYYNFKIEGEKIHITSRIPPYKPKKKKF